MAVRRFYCAEIGGEAIELDDAQAAHARKALRLREGDAVELFDGAGGVAEGRISALGPRLVVAVTGRRTVPRPTPTLDLAAAIPKGDRAATLIEAAAQLGVDRLIPLVTERSVVDPGAKKRQRFERIAADAARQSERAWVMAVDPPTDLPALLRRADHDLKLLCDVPAEAVQPLQGAGEAGARMAEARRALVLVGPEGGWTADERRAAAAAGCLAWTFSDNVLRVETAALAAAAILRSL